MRFGNFRKVVSNRSLLSGFREEYSDVMKRLLPILSLVFSVGVGAETIEYSGCTYTGELKDGHPHGQGTLTCSNDTFWNLHELIFANSRIVNEASIAED